MNKNLDRAALNSTRRSSLFNRTEAFAKSGQINPKKMPIDQDSLDMKSSRELLLELPEHYQPYKSINRRRSSSFTNVLPLGPVQSMWSGNKEKKL